MSLCCVYHKSLPMQVVEDAQADEMVATGEWFYHVNDFKLSKKEKEHEKQIRQQSRKRCSNS